MHELNIYDFELPEIDDWFAGDDREIQFQVVDDQGNGVDITAATVEWELYERPYQTDPNHAVVSGTDSDVELVTDARVDTSNGEWSVIVETSATEDLWGEFYHRPNVIQPDQSNSSWRGPIILTA